MTREREFNAVTALAVLFIVFAAGFLLGGLLLQWIVSWFGFELALWQAGIIWLVIGGLFSSRK